MNKKMIFSCRREALTVRNLSPIRTKAYMYSMYVHMRTQELHQNEEFQGARGTSNGPVKIWEDAWKRGDKLGKAGIVLALTVNGSRD